MDTTYIGSRTLYDTSPKAGGANGEADSQGYNLAGKTKATKSATHSQLRLRNNTTGQDSWSVE